MPLIHFDRFSWKLNVSKTFEIEVHVGHFIDLFRLMKDIKPNAQRDTSNPD